MKEMNLKSFQISIAHLMGSLFLCSLIELLHIVVFTENISQYFKFILTIFLTGLIASILLIFILSILRKWIFFELNYILGVYSYYFVIPVFIGLSVYSFWALKMNRHIFYFFPGPVAATSYLFYQYKFENRELKKNSIGSIASQKYQP